MIVNQKVHDAFRILGKGNKNSNSYLINKDGVTYLVYDNWKHSDRLGEHQVVINLGKTGLNDSSYQIKTTVNDIQKGLKFFKSKFIELDIEGNYLILKSEDKSLNVELVVDDTISVPNLTEVNRWNFELTKFKQRVESVYPMRSRATERPFITGITFNEYDIVALDGYKMGVSTDKSTGNKLPCINIYKDESKYLIDILKILNKKEDNITIITNENKMVIFEIGNVRLISRYNDEMFNYKNILRTDDESKFENVNVKELLDNIKFMESVSNYINITNDKFIGYDDIQSVHTDNSTCSVDLKYDNTNEIDIFLNIKFVREILVALNRVKDTTTVGFHGKLNPVVFRSEDLHYIVLPIRVRG